MGLCRITKRACTTIWGYSAKNQCGRRTSNKKGQGSCFPALLFMRYEEVT